VIAIRAATAGGAAAGQAEVRPGDLKYDPQGLLPVVVQDVATGAVLMVAWADRAAVEETLATGLACFWSRSRQAPWRKGETSGHRLEVVEALADCDLDTLLLRARPTGPACHTGARSCFEPNPAALELGWLARVLEERRDADPAQSYTARLLAGGVERVAQKVGEEGVETALAAVAGVVTAERRRRFVGEAADLLYHLLALLAALEVAPAEVAIELAERHRARTGPPDSVESVESEEGDRG
jgi:phosphoribosyl-AMP cyclohydrolase / phosphoribosyl-ATP pyrophosphohydrolase